MFENLGKDLRLAVRMLGKSRAVAAVAVLSLALGLGGVTALFSLIDAVMLRRLPVADPGRLVSFSFANGPNEGRFSYPMLQYARQRSRSLTDLIAYTREALLVARVAAAPAAPSAAASPAVAGEAPAESANGQLVSGNFFSALGVRPALGRLLGPGDDLVPGGHPLAVISYGYWQRRFGSQPEAIGRVVMINGSPFTIIGVAPRGFFGVLVGSAPDFFLPVMMQREIRYRNNSSIYAEVDLEQPWVLEPHISFLNLIGRLRPGATPARARAELDLLFHQFTAGAFAGSADHDSLLELQKIRVAAAPADRGVSPLRGQYAQPLLILMCAAGLVLLIACANIANLLLARAAGRRKEIAVRLSIGATRGRLVRQLLTESLLLAAAGGAAGVLVAFWGRRLLLGLAAIDASTLSLDAGLDLRMLAFTAGASLCTALVFGVVPALQATRVDVAAHLKEGGRTLQGAGAERSRVPVGKLLVIAQVSLSLLLLIGSGLFLRSLGNLDQVKPGFARDHLLLARLNPRLLGLSDAQLANLYQRLLDRVVALPGVRSTSLSLHPLLSGSSRTSSAKVAGYTPRPTESMEVQVMLVTPGYFDTVGMQLVEGRAMGPQDRAGAAAVAVINQAMARRFFPPGPVAGRRLGLKKRADETEIVGMVRDARMNSLKEEAPPTVFLPVAQEVDALGDLEVRTAGDPGALAAALRQALREVEPGLPIISIRTLEEQIGRSLGSEHAVARLTAIFGLLALALAGIGLYGVMAYGVARRTNEIGLRMALGARRASILGLVLRETLLLTAVGIALGLPAALAAAPLAKSQLFGLTASDPPTLAIATLLMILVTATTGLLPAQRAASVDPMIALRAE
jgi:predicted permease